MRFAVANCTFTSGEIISKFEEISTIAVFMCHDELGDELGFDDFDDEIFVMTFLVTKFRRRHPDDVSGDEISSPTLSPTLSSNSSSNSLSNLSSNSSSIKHKLTTNLMTNLTTNLMTKLTTKLMTKFRSQKRHPDAGDEISLPITS